MKTEKENALLHKIHAWASLIVNTLIALSIRLVNNSLSFNISDWILIFNVLIAVIMSAVSRISLDMSQNDVAISSLIFQYVCALILSIIIVYTLYEEISLKSSLIIIIAIVIEVIIAFIIIFRYRIRRWFRKLRKKKR